jgi:UDP-4-amino-4,6-dideoxy-N-acetyl-beta-L-altrosamine N-acetyltransferase
MTETAIARDLRRDDLSMVLGWRNATSIRAVMFNRREILPDEHIAWFERMSRDEKHRLLIIEDSGGPQGFVQFSDARVGGVSSWGFYARPGAPRGAGRRIGFTALNFAFRNLHVHKVCGEALAFNEASIRLHERLGFTREGVLRHQHQEETSYHDVLCFGLLQSEWETASTAFLHRSRDREGEEFLHG